MSSTGTGSSSHYVTACSLFILWKQTTETPLISIEYLKYFICKVSFPMSCGNFTARP